MLIQVNSGWLARFPVCMNCEIIAVIGY